MDSSYESSEVSSIKKRNPIRSLGVWLPVTTIAPFNSFFCSAQRIAGVGEIPQSSTFMPPDTRPEIRALASVSAVILTSLHTINVPSFSRNEANVNPSFAANSEVISVLALPRIPDVPKSLNCSIT